MAVASNQTIRKLRPLVFMEERGRFNGMSYGLGPCGYDLRIAENLYLAPGDFSLASTMEEFNMPNNLVGIVHDKSTLARLGIAVQNTVIEPGWKGFLTLELTNHGKEDIRIPSGSPICQVIFHLLDEPTVEPYDGKYQNQKRGIQQPILER